jgi:hypothetical protein
MSGISGPSGPGSVGKSGGVNPTEALAEAGEIQGPSATSAATVVAQAPAVGAVDALPPALALFDRIAASLAHRPDAGREDAVRTAVAAVIEDAIPGLSEEARSALIQKVTEAATGDHELSARLDRLLKVAG